MVVIVGPSKASISQFWGDKWNVRRLESCRLASLKMAVCIKTHGQHSVLNGIMLDLNDWSQTVNVFFSLRQKQPTKGSPPPLPKTAPPIGRRRQKVRYKFLIFIFILMTEANDTVFILLRIMQYCKEKITY